jgi:hypothetical protein
VVPVQRRKARWNALGSEKPSRRDSSSIDPFPRASAATATSRRSWSRTRWNVVSSAASLRRSVCGLIESRAATCSGPGSPGAACAVCAACPSAWLSSRRTCTETTSP